MNRRDNMRKGRTNGNTLLILVMIGFCILALIEIIYGQVQIRMQKERMALEEENHRTVQELKAEWDQLKGDPNVGTEATVEVGEGKTDTNETEKTLTNTQQPSETQQPEADNTAQQPAPSDETDTTDVAQTKEYDMQIVFMGDSILDSDRENHGVA